MKVINHTRLWDIKLTWYPPSSPCQICLYDLEHNFGIDCFGLPDHAWLTRFLQAKKKFLNHLVTVLWSMSLLPFTWQMFLLVSTVLSPSLNLETFHVGLYVFQITYRVKQCKMCQCTNYHYTTNHSMYLQQLELLWSHDIHAANDHILKHCKIFESPKYIFLYIFPHWTDFWLDRLVMRQIN